MFQFIQDDPILGMQVFLLNNFVVTKECSDLVNEDETFDGLEQSRLTEKLLFLVELIGNRVLLEMPLSLEVVIAQSHNSSKLAFLCGLFQFQQNQSTLKEHLVSMYLNTRGERRFHLRNYQLIGWICKVVVVLCYLISIWNSIHFEGLYVITGNGNLLVIGCGEEGEVELLKDIFLDIVVVDCAEIVESSDILQFFAYVRLKLAGDSHNREVYSFLCCTFNRGTFF